jgi:hypothetical protein
MWSLPLATFLREIGQSRAETAWGREDVLDLGRELARRLALERKDREVTADDVQLQLQGLGFGPGALGNAAGSLFVGPEWQFTGLWRKSERASNHAHQNRVWRLR